MNVEYSEGIFTVLAMYPISSGFFLRWLHRLGQEGWDLPKHHLRCGNRRRLPQSSRCAGRFRSGACWSSPRDVQKMGDAIWLVGTWMDYDFPFSWEWNNHPNWRTPSIWIFCGNGYWFCDFVWLEFGIVHQPRTMFTERSQQWGYGGYVPRDFPATFDDHMPTGIPLDLGTKKKVAKAQ